MTLEPKTAQRVAAQAAINRVMAEPVVVDVICPNCRGKTRVTRKACRHCHTVIPKAVRDNAPRTRGDIVARGRSVEPGGEAPASSAEPIEPNRAQRRAAVKAGRAEEIAVPPAPTPGMPGATTILGLVVALLLFASGCAGRVVVGGEEPAAAPQATTAAPQAGPTLAQLSQPQPAAAIVAPNDVPSELLGVFDAINRALKARDWIDLRLAFIAGAKRCGQLPAFRSTASSERDEDSKGASPPRTDTERRGEAAHDELDRKAQR